MTAPSKMTVEEHVRYRALTHHIHEQLVDNSGVLTSSMVARIAMEYYEPLLSAATGESDE
jgi:hypothetical protein